MVSEIYVIFTLFSFIFFRSEYIQLLHYDIFYFFLTKILFHQLIGLRGETGVHVPRNARKRNTALVAEHVL